MKDVSPLQPSFIQDLLAETIFHTGQLSTMFSSYDGRVWGEYGVINQCVFCIADGMDK